jgi:hypothetical protein
MVQSYGLRSPYRGCKVNCVTGYALRQTVGGSNDQKHSETRCPVR